MKIVSENKSLQPIDFNIYGDLLVRVKEVSRHADHQSMNIALNYIVKKGLEVVEKEITE